MGDLREEGPRRAEDKHRLVSGLLLEQGRDLFRRLGEIGGDSDMGLAGVGLRRERSEKRAQRRDKPCQLHDDLPLLIEPGEGGLAVVPRLEASRGLVTRYMP